MRKRDRLIPYMQRLTYPKAPRIAAVSHDVGSELVATLGGPLARSSVFVLPNPVDAREVRRRANGQHGIKARGLLRLCTVGRLAPEKAHSVLFDALALHGHGLGAWELLVIGDGPLRRLHIERVQSLGLQRRVKFLGRLTNPYPTMASSDVFVHASAW